MLGRVLIVAGSDSGGGAGLQADIKTVAALGGYAMTAVTAVTAQNTQGVFGVHNIPPDFVAQQITLCLEDIGADVVKTGMLSTADIIDAVADALDSDIPLVVDPVMVAKGGASLLEDDATVALKTRLIARARLITPNLPEAGVLLGREITTVDQMAQAAKDLLDLGPEAVLLKGGHLEGDALMDVLATAEGVQSFASQRIPTTSTHGTGCTTASALATGLAQGLSLNEATTRARAYVLEAIRTAPGYGRGHGPLNHGHLLT